MSESEADRVDVDSGGLLESVRAFQGGEAPAFDRLYEALWPGVYRRIVRMGVGADEAEEIAQRAMVRVYLYAAKAEFESESRLRSWVYVIAAREVYKQWQRRRPGLVSDPEILETVETSEAEDEGDPSEAAAGAEELADLEDCMGRLDADSRAWLGAPLVQGLTFRDAAKVFGLTLGQFKHRYETALGRLRDCMRRKGHAVE